MKNFGLTRESHYKSKINWARKLIDVDLSLEDYDSDEGINSSYLLLDILVKNSEILAEEFKEKIIEEVKIDDFEKEKLKKMLGLRLIEEGVNYSEKDAKKVEKLIKNGLIEEFFIEKNEKIKFKNKKNFVKNYEKRIKLTKKGLFLANNVFVEFI